MENRSHDDEERETPSMPSFRGWLAAAREGAKKSNAIALSSGFLGILYGAACAALGISPALSVASSLLVFSGVVQFVSLSMLDEPLPLAAITVSALLVANRLVVMGGSIAWHLKNKPLIARILSLHMLTDGSWAALVTTQTKESERLPFFIGAGAWVLFLWAAGTMLGTAVAGLFDGDTIASLRFSGVLFLALLLLLVVRNAKMGHYPWLVSMIVSLIAHQFLPLPLTFLIGMSAGAAFAWLRPNGSKQDDN
jgi:predicted branched-subunit amino acid permease